MFVGILSFVLPVLSPLWQTFRVGRACECESAADMALSVKLRERLDKLEGLCSTYRAELSTVWLF